MDKHLLQNYKALPLIFPLELLTASLHYRPSSCFKNPSFGRTALLARTTSSACSVIALELVISYKFNLGKTHVMLGHEVCQDTGG